MRAALFTPDFGSWKAPPRFPDAHVNNDLPNSIDGWISSSSVLISSLTPQGVPAVLHAFLTSTNASPRPRPYYACPLAVSIPVVLFNSQISGHWHQEGSYVKPGRRGLLLLCADRPGMNSQKLHRKSHFSSEQNSIHTPINARTIFISHPE